MCISDFSGDAFLHSALAKNRRKLSKIMLFCFKKKIFHAFFVLQKQKYQIKYVPLQHKTLYSIIKY